MKTTQIQTRITEKLKEDFIKAAEEKGMTYSDALRYIIFKFIEQSKEDDKN